MATNTTKLEQAYAKRNKALKTAADATEQEYIAQEKEIKRDTNSALENAYVQKIRADYRRGQENRASGITGGQAIRNSIASDNVYSGVRTDLQLDRETSLSAIDRERKISKANLKADLASNELAKESDLLSIREGDDDHRRSVYSSMLSNGYVPADAKEAQEMADLFGVPLESIKAYVSFKNK